MLIVRIAFQAVRIVRILSQFPHKRVRSDFFKRLLIVHILEIYILLERDMSEDCFKKDVVSD